VITGVLILGRLLEMLRIYQAPGSSTSSAVLLVVVGVWCSLWGLLLRLCAHKRDLDAGATLGVALAVYQIHGHRMPVGLVFWSVGKVGVSGTVVT
jgi:hypothetical protein